MEDGYHLGLARRKAGVRQAELASLLHVSRQTIISWEHDEQLPEHKAIAYRDALSRLSETSSTPPTAESSSFATVGGASS
jgi:DNA-binding XRE family transcriptional regulator